MAEAVRQQLEAQVAELEDLRRRGIFTAEEIGRIVKKRRAFEYALRRRQVLKSDFLKYIEYELNVELLRKRRKEERGLRAKNTPSEFAIVRRLHFLFGRALQKFKGDVRLWLQYFDFCMKTDSQKVLSRAFVSAIRFHPRNADLWIRAAKWEFESNSNIAAARALMQRALRLNRDDKMLWREYFRLELLYWDKIRKRRQVLGLPLSTTVTNGAPAPAPAAPATALSSVLAHAGDSDSDDAGDDHFLIEEAPASTTTTSTVTVPPLAEEAGAAPVAEGDAFLSGNIPRAVFRAACGVFPSDAEFLLSFLPIYRLFRGTEQARAEVYDSLPLCEQALAAKARRPLDDAADDALPAVRAALVEEADKLFTSSTSQLATAAMFDAHITFLWEQLSLSSPFSDLAHSLTQRVQAVCAEAAQRALASETCFSIWLDVLTSTGATAEDVLRVAEAATSALPKSASLWHRQLSLLGIFLQPFSAFDQVALAAASHLQADGAQLEAILSRRIHYATVTGQPAAVLEQCFLDALAACPLSHTFASMYVDTMLFHGGLAGARAAYNKVLHAARTPLAAFFGHCIDLESTQPRIDMKAARLLCERAVSSHGAHDDGIWLRYCELELQHGTPERANACYFRAIKALPDPQRFISEHALALLRVESSWR